MAGGLGGLGGFGNILQALGQSLLSSPSGNPFATLPQHMQAVQQQREHTASLDAMSRVAKQLGIPEEIAANPIAMSLLIQQMNTQKRADLVKQYAGQPSSLTPPGDATPPVVPPAPPAPPAPAAAPGSPAGGLGGFGGMTSSAPITGTLQAAEAAVKNNESGGPAGNYSAVGRDVNGDRAYGAYQVMGANIPAWTRKHLGRELSVKEFLASPEAQDQVFQGEFGSYLTKYGNPADAFSMWFSGKPVAQAGNASDGNMTVPQYVAKAQRFMAQNGGDAAPAQTAQPVQVAAAGKSIPVPINPPPLPSVTKPTGANATKAWAQQNLDLTLRRIAVFTEAGMAGSAEAEKAKIPLYVKWLEPSEITRGLVSAGIDPNSDQARSLQLAAVDKRPEAVRTAEAAFPGEPRRAQQAIQAGLPDNRPAEVKLGQAAQDTPGLVQSGIETETTKAASEASARDMAAARARFGEQATAAAQSAQTVLPALNEARTAFEAAVKAGGTGFFGASPAARLGGQVFSTKAEAAREKFDNAIAAVNKAKSAVEMKGQGSVSNYERELAAADLPSLRSTDPETARQALNRLQTNLERALDLDRRQGLFGGAQGAMTPRGDVGLPAGRIRFDATGNPIR